MVARINHPKAWIGVAHQCMYGLGAPTGYSDKTANLPALKPTTFMHNSPHMLRKLGKRCSRRPDTEETAAQTPRRHV